MKNGNKISRYIRFIFFGILFLLIFSIILNTFRSSKYYRALPASATDIMEYHHNSSWASPDYVHILKARLPEKDYEKYAKTLGLKEKYDPKIHGQEYNRFNIPVGGLPDWWDEPDELNNCYFNYIPGEEYCERIKWKEGCVFFLSISW